MTGFRFKMLLLATAAYGGLAAKHGPRALLWGAVAGAATLYYGVGDD